MKLSIIIPIYNGETYLEQCLQSVVREADSETEIIIVDDGSTDRSAYIYDKYRRDTVRIYKNTNHGVSFSRNFGIKKATGEYLLFLDADDFLKKGWSQSVYSALNKSTADILYFSSFFSSTSYSKDDVIQKIVGYNSKIKANMAGILGKIYRKDVLLNRNILFKENIINGEDLLFNLHAIISAQTYSFHEESIYEYRINYASATHTFNKKIFESNTIFLDKLKDYLNMSQLNECVKKELYDFSLFHSIFIFAYRICLIDDKKERRNLNIVFEDEMYSNYLKQYKRTKKYGFIKGIYVYFIKKRWYAFTYFWIRVSTYFIKTKKKIKNSEQEEI